MNVRRLAAWFAVPAAVAIGISACSSGGSSSSTSSGGSNGGTVSIGIAEPQHLIPTNAVENNGFQVLTALYVPLVKYDDKGNVVLTDAQASSVTSPDNKVWTIKLRPGYKFSNGEPVNAASYIRAWNYGAYGPNAQLATNFFEKIAGYDDLQSANASTPPKAKTMSGLTSPDDMTIQVTLAQPFAEFEKVLGYNSFYPLPAAAFAPDGTLQKNFESAPIGDGPFQMKGVWNHNQSIDVTKSATYPGVKPHVNEIDFKIYEDQDTMYSDLQAGNLDVQPQIPSDKLASAQVQLGSRLQKTPSSYFGYITIPDYDPAFKNVNIRRAISMAINRPEIINKIFENSYIPADSWVSPIVQGARANTCGANCKFNPTEAKQLWTQAGGVPGNKISLYYNSDGGHKEWVDAVCNELTQNLGVQCTGAPVAQFADLRAQADQHKLQGLLRGAWAFDYPSIEDYLSPIYQTGAPSNDAQYSNPAFDAQLTKADQATSQAAAIQGYQAAEDIVAQDLPTIPMWFKDNIFGSAPTMKTVQMDLFANVNLLTLQRN